MKESRIKRSGQIPAFGNWENANELPITQYFESARQAGLIRYSSSSSGDCDPYMVSRDFNKKQPSPAVVPPLKIAMREKRSTHVKEQGKHQMVVSDVTAPPTTRKTIQNKLLLLHHPNYVDAGPTPKLPAIAVVRAPKPVDEDLYKISPVSSTFLSGKRCWHSFQDAYCPLALFEKFFWTNVT